MLSNFEAVEVFKKWRGKNNPKDFFLENYKKNPNFEYATIAISLSTKNIFINYTDLRDDNPWVCDVCGVCCVSLEDFENDLGYLNQITLHDHLEQIDDHYRYHNLRWVVA